MTPAGSSLMSRLHTGGTSTPLMRSSAAPACRMRASVRALPARCWALNSRCAIAPASSISSSTRFQTWSVCPARPRGVHGRCCQADGAARRWPGRHRRRHPAGGVRHAVCVRRSRCRPWAARRRATNRMEMAMDADYYDGIQWDPADKASVEHRGRMALVYNEVAPMADWMIGTERRNRVDWKVPATHGGQRRHRRREDEGHQVQRRRQPGTVQPVRRFRRHDQGRRGLARRRRAGYGVSLIALNLYVAPTASASRTTAPPHHPPTTALA